jgi:hypothetical protein
VHITYIFKRQTRKTGIVRVGFLYAYLSFTTTSFKKWGGESMKNYKKTCADCAALVEDEKGNWYCDENYMCCEDVEECPEGVRAC